MNSNNYVGAYGGFSLSTLLAIAFVVLKLCGVIDWSWWWVFSPLWIPAALAIIFFIILVIIKISADRN